MAGHGRLAVVASAGVDQHGEPPGVTSIGNGPAGRRDHDEQRQEGSGRAGAPSPARATGTAASAGERQESYARKGNQDHHAAAGAAKRSSPFMRWIQAETLESEHIRWLAYAITLRDAPSASETHAEPPFCADIGCISIKMLATRIRVFCAPASWGGAGDRVCTWEAARPARAVSAYRSCMLCRLSVSPASHRALPGRGPASTRSPTWGQLGLSASPSVRCAATATLPGSPGGTAG